MLLTGGLSNNSNSISRVSEYSDTGYVMDLPTVQCTLYSTVLYCTVNCTRYVRDLPPLQQGRSHHGCSYYVDDKGIKVLFSLKVNRIIFINGS